MSEVKEKIRKVVDASGLTQLQFALKAGILPTTLPNYLAGNRKPDALNCLLIAAMAKGEDRNFFIRLSGLSDLQLLHIRNAISLDVAPQRAKEPKERSA